MIPGVSDRSRLPRLGKVRLGEKAKSAGGKEYPKALDHFNFTDVPEVETVFGKGCRELFPVLLPADDEDVFFPTARKAYRKSGLFCACSDGATATRVYVKEDVSGNAYLKETGQTCEDGEMYELPCPADECDYRQNKFCKDIGRLMFMLPTVPKFGVYEISTTSFNSVVNVLNYARAIRTAIGTVVGVQFALVLKPMQVQPEGKAKTVYVLDLEYRGSLAQLAGVGRRLKAAGGGALALLEAHPDDTPDDLMPNAGAALDAALGGPPVPPASKLAAEPGTGKLDQLTGALKGGPKSGLGVAGQVLAAAEIRQTRKEAQPEPGQLSTDAFVDGLDDDKQPAPRPAPAAPVQQNIADF